MSYADRPMITLGPRRMTEETAGPIIESLNCALAGHHLSVASTDDLYGPSLPRAGFYDCGSDPATRVTKVVDGEDVPFLSLDLGAIFIELRIGVLVYEGSQYFSQLAFAGDHIKFHGFCLWGLDSRRLVHDTHVLTRIPPG
jgi:hypothetical protein